MALSQSLALSAGVIDILIDNSLDTRIITLMTDDFYKTALQSALKELAELSDKREEARDLLNTLEERIEKVRQGALGLASLADVDFDEVKKEYPKLFADQIDPRMGITDAVREALRANGDLMSPADIQDAVFRISPAVAGHKNPLASIYAVLRRLTDGDEVLVGLDSGGRTVYGWCGTDEALDHIAKRFAHDDNFNEVVSGIKTRRAKKKIGDSPKVAVDETFEKSTLKKKKE
jgi:hypothetical protein